MAFFDDIINHPNFGALFTGSNAFRTLFNRMVGDSEDVKVQAINKKLSFARGPSGNLVLKSRELDYTYEQGPGETPSDFLRRVLTGRSQMSTPANFPVPPRRQAMADPAGDIGFSYVKSSEVIEPEVTYDTMAKRNFRLGRTNMERIAREQSLTIRYRTLEGGPDALEAAYSMIGRDARGEPLGIIRADEKIHRVAEFWDKEGNKLPYSRAMQVLGISPDKIANTLTVNKRLNAFFNAPQISIEFDHPGDLKRAVFDPREFYEQDKLTKTRTEFKVDTRLADDLKNGIVTDRDDALKKMYSSYSDGQILMDEDVFKRHVRRMSDQYESQTRSVLQKKLDDGSITPAKFRRDIAQMEKIVKDLKELDQTVKKGLKMNMRAIGGVNVADPTGESFGFAKGDLVLINKADKRAILKRIGGVYEGMTKEQLDEIVFITDTANQKAELGPLDRVRPFLTFDPVSKPHELSWTNTIGLSSYGEMLNPIMPSGRTFLEESFQTEWRAKLDQISQGDMGGLRKLVKEINEINIDNYDDFNERQAILDNKAFARRLKDFIESGGRVEMNETMTADLYRIARAHFFRERKFGNTIRIGGEDVKDLALRIPQLRSTRAHVTTKEDMSKVGGYITDRLSLNLDPDLNGTSTFGLNGSDIEMIKAAHGGMDLDDALSLNTYVYDPNTKRMMAFMTRDPESLSEYMYMDAQFGKDRNFQKAVVDFHDRAKNTTKSTKVADLTERRKKVLNEIEDMGNKIQFKSSYGKKKSLELQSLFTELSDLNEAIDRYLQNDQLIPSVDLANRYSLDAATQAFRRAYAPLDWRTTTESLAAYRERSLLRSYTQISKEEIESDIGKLMMRFKYELDLNQLDIAQLPWEYARPGFTELVTGEGGVGESDLFVDFRKTHATEIAEQLVKEKAAESRVFTAAERIAHTEQLNKAAAEAQYLLGRVTNATTIINEALVNNTTLQDGGLSAEEITKFKEIVKKNDRIIYMPKESVIDPITKTGDLDYLQIIQDVNKKNLRTIGKIMGEAGPRFGFDPVTLAQRGGLTYKDETMEALISKDFAELIAGYRETSGVGKDVTYEEIIERLSLRPDDPRAKTSRIFQQQIDNYKESLELEESARRTANQNLMDLIEGRTAEGDIVKGLPDLKPSDLEQSRAEEFLDEFHREREAQKRLTGTTSDEIQAFLRQSLEGDVDLTGDVSQVLSDTTKNTLNTNSLRRLQKWGLFDDRDKLYRQLLAIAQTSVKNQEAADDMSYSTLSSLMQITTEEGGTSVEQLFTEAQRWREEQFAHEEVRSLARNWDGFGSIDEYFKNTINPAMRRRGKMRGFVAFQKSRLDAVNIMRARGGQGFQTTLTGIGKRLALTPGDRGLTPEEIAATTPDEELETLTRVVDDMSQAEQRAARDVDITVTPGARRLEQRSITDTVSSAVRKWKPMKNFDRAEFSRLLSAPGFRKGLGIAGIFAGLGLFHEMRGDRTQAQMEGPPLLPGGSSYERLPTESLPQPAAIPITNQGYTYKVRAQGNFDANGLSGELGNITGSSVNGTIYPSQERYNPAGLPNATDILNSLIPRY